MQMKTLPFSSLFVELDALLDTRASILGIMGEGVLEEVMKDGYHNRLTDMFPKVNNELFKELYTNRTKALLTNTLPTSIVSLLIEFCTATARNVINTPFHYKPKIIVNIHPYKLTNEEIAPLLASVVTLTKQLADVEIVDMEYSAITPKYIKDNISVIILYEYYKWLELHSESKAITKTTSPDVTMFGPRLYFDPKHRNNNLSMDPFEAMESLAAPFIGLQLLPVSQFSFVYPYA